MWAATQSARQLLSKVEEIIALLDSSASGESAPGAIGSGGSSSGGVNAITSPAADSEDELPASQSSVRESPSPYQEMMGQAHESQLTGLQGAVDYWALLRDKS